jgi:ankyrin repeat protein
MSHELVEAARKGNLQEVKRLVDEGADLHYGSGCVLRWSAHNGHLEVVKYVVENGVDIHYDGVDALCQSAGNGHLDVVKFLAEQGANIHARGNYALRYAAIGWHSEVVEYLVEQGASLRSAVVGAINIEVKRRVCEYFGWERIVKELGAKEIHKDEYGILLKTSELKDDDSFQANLSAKFVRVTCPSTGEKYVLRVDPNVQTAKEAVASTFGLTEEQYCPVVER